MRWSFERQITTIPQLMYANPHIFIIFHTLWLSNSIEELFNPCLFFFAFPIFLFLSPCALRRKFELATPKTPVAAGNCVNDEMLQYDWLLTALIYGLIGCFRFKLSDLICPITNICNAGVLIRLCTATHETSRGREPHDGNDRENRMTRFNSLDSVQIWVISLQNYHCARRR